MADSCRGNRDNHELMKTAGTRSPRTNSKGSRAFQRKFIPNRFMKVRLGMKSLHIYSLGNLSKKRASSVSGSYTEAGAFLQEIKIFQIHKSKTTELARAGSKD